MEDIMTIEQTAEFLGCCTSSIRNKIKKKEIPCRFIGGKYIFSKKALTLWLTGVEAEMIVENLLRRWVKWKT